MNAIFWSIFLICAAWIGALLYARERFCISQRNANCVNHTDEIGYDQNDYDTKSHST